jgi:hypothetical protein
MAMQLVILLCLVTSAFAAKVNEAYGGDITGSPLGTGIYQYSCPEAENIIFSWVEQAVSSDPRMAASLLRLHFHDCFVNASLSFFTFNYSLSYLFIFLNGQICLLFIKLRIFKFS